MSQPSANMDTSVKKDSETNNVIVQGLSEAERERDRTYRSHSN